MMAVKTAVNQPEEKNAQRDAGEKEQACYMSKDGRLGVQWKDFYSF